MKKRQPTAAAREAEGYKVALDDFPEFAAQVGVLISCFAMIESYVHVLISRLTGTSESDAFVFSGSFMNFRARVDLLQSLAKVRNPKDQSAIIAKHFVSLLREATGIRNRYAHGRYGLSFEGGSYSPTAKKIIYIDSSLFDANKRPVQAVRDLDDVIKEVQRIKFIVCEMHAYLHRNEPPQLPDGP